MLYTTLEVVRIAALLIQPVMPESGGQAARPAWDNPLTSAHFSAIGDANWRSVRGTAHTPEGRFPPATSPGVIYLTSRRSRPVTLWWWEVSRGHDRLTAQSEYLAKECS